MGVHAILSAVVQLQTALDQMPDSCRGCPFFAINGQDCTYCQTIKQMSTEAERMREVLKDV